MPSCKVFRWQSRVPVLADALKRSELATNQASRKPRRKIDCEWPIPPKNDATRFLQLSLQLH